MKAMILAAGKGERLRPLTEHCPKPLVKVGGKPLIIYHIEKLKACGVTEIIINVHHLGGQVIEALGTGEAWGVRLTYSQEKNLLETGGGICTALPLLGKEPFILINGDIWTDFDFKMLPKTIESLGYLILVDNPPYYLEGDYGLTIGGIISDQEKQVGQTYTYSGIAVLHPDLFEGCEMGVPFKLSTLFDNARFAKRLEGQHYRGEWTDVGTSERLAALDERLNQCSTYTVN